MKSHSMATFQIAAGAALALLLAAHATAAPPVFAARHDYAVYGLIAVGDINGDGLLDVVTFSGGEAETLLGSPSGVFSTGPVSTEGNAMVGVPALADVNGDGKLDLIFSGEPTPSNGNFGFFVSLGNGDGSFESPQLNFMSSSLDLGDVLIGDFNGDGIPDIAAPGIGGIYSRLGNGDGTFQPAVLSPADWAGSAYAVVGDFNGDSKLDIAAATVPGFSVFLGKGDGAFQSPLNVPNPQGPNTIATAT